MGELFDNREDDINRIHKVLEENGIFPDEIEEDEDLDMDSLTRVSLLVCFENEFGFVFSDEDLVELPTTYNGLVQLILDIKAQHDVSMRITEDNFADLLRGMVEFQKEE